MSTAVAKRESAEVAEHNPQLEAMRRIASQQTPKNEIRVRVGRGGMQLKYTDGAYVIRTLNAAFGWDWDFVADSEELLTNNGQPFEVKVRGTLTVRLDGKAVTKTQYGCQPIEMLKNGQAPVSIGDCYKGAATDALKKCASLLGIALDLYDSDYKPEKYTEPADEQIKAEPVCTVKGAPPAREPSDKLPSLRGYAGQITALANQLGWDEGYLREEIISVCKVELMNDLAVALPALPQADAKMMIQSLKAELESRNRTK